MKQRESIVAGMTFARVLLKRLLLSLVTLWLLSVLVFGGAQLLPGDVGRAMLGPLADASVVATLNRAVGADLARQVKVFAGDIVPKKKPAPDIYLVALDWVGLPAGQVVVIEDSRNGLVAATGAGLATVITVNELTRDEDFSEAALVVSSLGDPGGERAVVLANRTKATPGDWITLTDLSQAR